jgi:type IV pilus assembly protein PilA
MVTLENDHEHSGKCHRQRGFSLIELLVVIGIILIIAALAIPNFLQAKISANQGSAASTVRTINTASAQYSTAWSNGFPASLPALGTVGGAPNCNGAQILDPSIAAAPNQKSGYIYAYTPEGPAVSNPPPGCVAGYSSYLVTAMPVNVFTGTSSFCSDESFTLHYSSVGAAIATPAACEALPAMQ